MVYTRSVSFILDEGVSPSPILNLLTVYKPYQATNTLCNEYILPIAVPMIIYLFPITSYREDIDKQVQKRLCKCLIIAVEVAKQRAAS